MVQKTKTEMLKTSAIIYMQNLLSKENCAWPYKGRANVLNIQVLFIFEFFFTLYFVICAKFLVMA